MNIFYLKCSQRAVQGNRGSGDEKFATYTRSSFSGLDYADQRYYASSYGRFNTADPYKASAAPADPGTWNRYAYVAGDPVNRMDPRGTCYVSPQLGFEWDDEDADALAYNGGLPDGTLSWSYGFCQTGSIDPGLDPCAQIDDSNALLAASLNCAAPVVAVGYPVSKQQDPSQPQCFAQLKDRPVDDPTASKFRAVHTFWWVQADVNGQAEQFIISAGPQQLAGSPKQYLDAWVVPGSANGADNSGDNTAWASGLSASLCDQVEAMLTAARGFPQNQIQYNPAGAFGFGGPNSNSAAHYFGIAGGFTGITPPLTAYGWNSYIPSPNVP